MKNIFKILLYFFLLMVISCQRFLEENPDSSLSVDLNSEEKISELLTGAYPAASYAPFLEPRTDNIEERVNGIHNRLNEAMYFWEDYDQEDLDTPLNYWNSCYEGIAKANKALELLANYPKTEKVKSLYGEAFLLRAYLHFMLVNIWAEPYRGRQSASDLGIPYVEKPEKNAIVQYKRGTVAEVYDKIEKDLKLGISLVNDAYYKSPKFHFNKKAAYAFASRFYLMKGEWNLVIQYADYVLGGDPTSIVRNWNQYTKKYFFNRKQLYHTYTSSNEPANLLLTTTESRLKLNTPTQKYAPTYSLVSSIFADKGIEGCSAYKKLNLDQLYLFVNTEGALTNGSYIPKFDELSLHGSVGSHPRDLYVTNVLFSTDEVLLNRMEAYAMSQDYDHSIDDLYYYLIGKFDLDLPCSRDTYTTTNTSNYNVYTPFYGLTIKQLALVKIITELRQKEFYQEGLRWFDIRRFYLPVSRKTKNSIYVPLGKQDFRKVLQIPVEAINNGLQPNPR